MRERDEAVTPLRVESARYEVTILDHVARTQATLVFHNAADRTYEGELVYPLPGGAVVSGFALDVQGRLVDAVLVEAREARVAFETEVRKGVDPGLVEWVRGSTFRTRIWPVPPKGRRTVRVEYASELPSQGAETVYELPLRFGTPLAELSVRVEIAGADGPPMVRSGPPDFAFGPWQERLVAEATQRHVAPQDLILALPSRAGNVATVETEPTGERYFAIDDLPIVPAPTPAGGVPVRRIAVLWDASLSRDTADRDRDLRILGAHLARLGQVDVDVVVFRDVAEPPRRFTVHGGDAGAVLAALKAASCDGATTLSTLRVPGGVAYALVFTDGVWTLGTTPAFGAMPPLFVLHGGSADDQGLLAAWAAASGGAAIDLARSADADALDRIGRPAYSLLSVEGEGGVADVEPRGPQPVDGRVTVTGRLTADRARVHLRYGYPGGAAAVTRTYEVRTAAGRSTGLTARRWAGRRVAALSLDQAAHDDEILDLGRRFGIVTPRTSLVVLETVEQYVAHGIRPPASLPDLQREYDERRAESARNESAERKERLESILAMWKEHVDWWTRRFDCAPGFRFTEEPTHSMGVTGAVPGGALPTVAPPPMRVEAPPPPPPPAPDSSTAFASVGALTETVSVSSGEPDGAPSATIAIAAWDPDTPYLKALSRASRAKAYDVYLAERRRFGTAPGFFLDCADAFARRGERRLALRILTNLAELRLEDARFLRVLAHRLEQLDELDSAADLFERVRRLRPEEPQSHRDLALVLDRRATRGLAADGPASDTAVADARRALALLAEVVMGHWDDRFDGVERLALEEANRLAALLGRAGVPVEWPLDPRLRQPLDLDLRIVLIWDTDLTDIDLWVTEPSGEQCDYQNPDTTIGGLMSNDFTNGYGPEVYGVRRAMPGSYRVRANFYGSGAQELTGPTTVQAIVVTDYGRPSERRRAMTLRLTEEKDEVDLGTVAFSGSSRRR